MSRQLYTLAYPNLASDDRESIEAFRRDHDLPFKDVVAAHFTMVFGNSELDEGRYIDHIKDVAAASKPIPFVCRYAMLGVDDENTDGYVFLVPDEGYSGISALHDQLYTGVFAPMLRLDVPFIPHITIGTVPTHGEAKALCDVLNSKELSVEGTLDTLSISVLRDNKITDIVDLILGQ